MPPARHHKVEPVFATREAAERARMSYLSGGWDVSQVVETTPASMNGAKCYHFVATKLIPV